ncbi:MAG: beta-N-acetylhexosaminidase [Bacteroidales bacterium]
MIRSLLCILVLCFARLVFAQEPSKGTLPLIPLPEKISTQGDAFRLTAKTIWRTSNSDQRLIVRAFSSRLSKALQWGGSPKMESLPARRERNSQTIDVFTDTSLPDEAYRLDVKSDRITIHTHSKSGLIYALQTLQRCMPQAVDSVLFAGGTLQPVGKEKREILVNPVQITDSPRFGWRGFMLDVARGFVPKEEIFRLLDLLAYHKINKFHWHLTDDQGWRLEIKRYPLLVETGAWNVTRDGYFPARMPAMPSEIATSGGYYSQRDVREIVAYAAERNIEVIPEIEMPAHALAALAAYPQMACPVAPQPLTVATGMGGPQSEVLFCAGNEEVFYFLQAILTEVVALFPSPYIHIGGREVSLTHWRTCPRCQSRIRKEMLDGTDDLRSYFMQRIASYLIRKGRQVIAWGDLVDAKLPRGSVIMAWKEGGEEGLRAGFLGYPFILNPVNPLFLNRYQGPQWFEPRTFEGDNTLYDIFHYQPLPQSTSSITANYLFGIQTSLPTEFVSDWTDISYLLFPRLAAFSERAWSRSDTSSAAWQNFLQRLDLLTPRFRAMGLSPGNSHNNIYHKVEARGDSLFITLSSQRSDAQIRYTTNGTEPSDSASRYTTSLLLKRPGADRALSGASLQQGVQTEIRANTFKQGSAIGSELVLPILWHAATGAPIRSTTPDGGVPERLINGLRGSDRHTDGEWVWWKGSDASVELTLQSSATYNTIAIGTLLWNGACVHLPSRITVFLSPNGVTYTKAGELTLPAEKSFENQLSLVTLRVPVAETQARFVRLELQNPGPCPDGHPFAGNSSLICLDEIIPYYDTTVISQ